MPAMFFFEPKGKAKKRQAYAFRRANNQAFALAGIGDTWHPSEGETADTCTMPTTGPNAVLKPIHDRMPVVVLAKNWDRWMDPKTPGVDVIDLLQPAPDDFLETWPVLDMDGNPEANGGYRSDIPEDQH